jgi:DegV family protein with EDD domain
MTQIITDTTSCLPEILIQKYQIPVIPQVINFGNESYLEGIELDNAGFYQKLSSSPELPKTAAPPVELFYKEFKRLEPLGEPVLCIHPSSEVSGTVRSALTAKMEFPSMDIRVMDTRLIAGPLATLVHLAAKWADEGILVDTIEQRLKTLAPQGRIYFLVPTLEFLRRGGRIGGAQALVGSLLQIKPILTFREGRVDQFEKVRTMHQALERIKELVVLGRDPHNPYPSVMHGNAPDAAKKLAGELQQVLGLDSIDTYNMPPAIVTHAGPGILAVGFFAPNTTGNDF